MVLGGGIVIDLSSLNEKQEEAVLKTEGPLLVLAGAGSGKTKVLTTRIAYLIKEKNVHPSSILAITFTNKAAKEMQGRLIGLVGRSALLSQVSTFHSFGLRILKENYDLLGYDKNFSILDSDDSLAVVKKIMKDFNIDPKKVSPKAIRNDISSCKNEMVMPKDYERIASSNNPYEQDVLRVYKKYEKTLKANNSVDFDDLLILPIILFKDNPSVLEEYQEKFQYVLIDEYQDTNEAQYILSKMISSKYKNICVVGDNDQAIYSFRGANYKNILNFEKDYPNCKVILLEENYRSTKNILDAANSVIKHNKDRKEKKLWSSKGDGDKISYFRAFSEKEEARFVASEIKKLIDNGVNYEDIAILYRTNAQSRTIEEAMLENSFPYRVVGSFYFYNRKEIKDLIAYLKLIYNSHDDISLLRVINTPKRGIGLKSIEVLQDESNRLGCSLYDAITSGKEMEFKKIIEDLKQESVDLTLTELVEKVLVKSGIRKELESEKTLEADVRLEYLEEFKSITKSFEERDGVISLGEFLEEVLLVSDREEYKDSSEKISLMTVHSVKGLEFDYVFVVGMEEGIFPHMNSLYEASQVEEERRLCYVAITRAKKKLYLVNARSRMLFGQDQINPPSRFLKEITSDLLEVIGKKEEKEIPFRNINMRGEKKMDSENKNDEDFSSGDRVEHDTFGSGIVIEASKTLVTVAFKSPIGIKKLMKNHASLHKI